MSSDMQPEFANHFERPSALQLGRVGTAIISVGLRPSRAAFSSWMQAIRPEQIRPLILLLCCLTTLNALVASVLPGVLKVSNGHAATPTLVGLLIFALVLSPLSILISLTVVVLVVAALMPATLGNIESRIVLIMRPYLLAQIAIVIVELMVHLLSLPVRLNMLTHRPPLIGWELLVAAAITVYQYVLSVNALSAVSTRSRWLLVAVVLLGDVAGFLLGQLLPDSIFALFGIQVPPL